MADKSKRKSKIPAVKAKQDATEAQFAEADAKAAPAPVEVDIEAVQAGLGVRGF